MSLEIDDNQIIKLGSLAQHAKELLGEGVHTTPAGEFDVSAIRGLLVDPEVSLLLAYLDKLGLLPVKR